MYPKHACNVCYQQANNLKLKTKQNNFKFCLIIYLDASLYCAFQHFVVAGTATVYKKTKY
jgi:hypothetical protein